MLTKEIKDVFALCAFLVLPVLVLTGVVVSVIVKPVFVNRYMIPAYGCFWLSVGIMASNEFKGLIELTSGREGVVSLKAASGIAGALLLALVLVVGYVDYKTFIWNENYRKTEMDKTLTMFEELGPETVIISNFDQVQALLGYYLNRNGEGVKVHLYQEEPEQLIRETVPGLMSVYDPVDIANYLSGGKEQ